MRTGHLSMGIPLCQKKNNCLGRLDGRFQPISIEIHFLVIGLAYAVNKKKCVTSMSLSLSSIELFCVASRAACAWSRIFMIFLALEGTSCAEVWTSCKRRAETVRIDLPSLNLVRCQ